LLEVWAGFIIILDQVVIEIKVEIVLRNLVLHNHCIWNALNDSSSLFLEEFRVFCLIESGVPGVFANVLAALNYED